MKEPEILRNIAKEQGEKEIRESHIRNRYEVGRIVVPERWFCALDVKCEDFTNE